MNITATLQARREEIQALLVSASADVEAAYKMHQEALAAQNALLDEQGLIDKLLAISGSTPTPNVVQTQVVAAEAQPAPAPHVSFDMALGMLSRQRQGAMNKLAILRLLETQPGMRTAELAGSTKLDSGVVAGIMQRLGDEEMVKGLPPRTLLRDRRGFEWFLTEKGLQFLQKYFR